MHIINAKYNIFYRYNIHNYAHSTSTRQFGIALFTRLQTFRKNVATETYKLIIKCKLPEYLNIFLICIIRAIFERQTIKVQHNKNLIKNALNYSEKATGIQLETFG